MKKSGGKIKGGMKGLDGSTEQRQKKSKLEDEKQNSSKILEWIGRYHGHLRLVPKVQNPQQSKLQPPKHIHTFTLEFMTYASAWIHAPSGWLGSFKS